MGAYMSKVDKYCRDMLRYFVPNTSDIKIMPLVTQQCRVESQNIFRILNKKVRPSKNSYGKDLWLRQLTWIRARQIEDYFRVDSRVLFERRKIVENVTKVSHQTQMENLPMFQKSNDNPTHMIWVRLLTHFGLGQFVG